VKILLNIIIAMFQIIWVFLFIGFWVVFYFSEYKKGKMPEVLYKRDYKKAHKKVGKK